MSTVYRYWRRDWRYHRRRSPGKTGISSFSLRKRPAPRGRASFLERDGHRFDTGPTLFLMPEVFAETYRALGEDMSEHLDLIRIDPTYRVHFHDGVHLDLTSDLVAMREQLDALEPGSFEAYLRFLSEGIPPLQRLTGALCRSELLFAVGILQSGQFAVDLTAESAGQTPGEYGALFQGPPAPGGILFSKYVSGCEPLRRARDLLAASIY